MDNQLGTQVALYRGSTGKGIINFVLTGIFGLLGLFMLGLPGGIMFAFLPFGVAIFLVVVTLRKISNSAITLYENGVAIQRRQRTQQWTFDQIDAVRIVGGKFSGDGPDIGIVGSMLFEKSLEYATRAPSSYDFFVDGRKVFSVQAYYDRWHELGGTLIEKTHTRLVQRLSGKLANGENVVFDRLRDGSALAELLYSGLMIRRYVKLTLNADGLRIKDGSLIQWDDLVLINPQESGELLSLRYGGKKMLYIKRYQSINALVAETLIKNQIGV